jgi:hypothetical protein
VGLGSGLNLINHTNLEYFQPEQVRHTMPHHVIGKIDQACSVAASLTPDKPRPDHLPHQMAELFRLKGLVLSSMDNRSEANQAFSHAAQLCPSYGKAWLAWGRCGRGTPCPSPPPHAHAHET